MSRRRHKRKRAEPNRRKSPTRTFVNTVSVADWARDLPPEEWTAHVAAAGEEFGEQFRAACSRLEELVLRANPLLTLATCGFYASVAAGLETAGASVSQGMLSIPGAELIQALVLRRQLDGYANQLPSPKFLDDLAECAETAMRGFAMKRLADIDASESSWEKARRLAVEEMRAGTQSLRGWAYPDQVDRFVLDLVGPLDELAVAELGVRLSSFVTMIYAIADEIAARADREIDTRRRLVKARAIDSLVDRYYELRPRLQDPPEALKALLRDRCQNVSEAQSVVFAHMDLGLSDIFGVGWNEVRSAYPGEVDEKRLRAALGSLSLGFGSLAATDPEHLFLGNPVWDRPFVVIDADTLILPLPSLVRSFAFASLERLLAESTELVRAYERRRASFLEETCKNLIASAIPSAQVWSGVVWRDEGNGVEYENDVVAVVDSHLVVVEAKSGGIHPSARRGAEGRLGKVAASLVGDPTNQARRLIDRLQSRPGIHELSTASGERLRIDSSQIRHYVPIGVSLEPLAMLQARSSLLEEAKMIDDSRGLSMSLSDLDAMVQVLDQELDFLHYLVKRIGIQATLGFFGDELDLLASYILDAPELDEGMAGGDHNEKVMWALAGRSRALDPFLMGRASRPKREHGQWWGKVLEHLQERHPLGWSAIGCLLLDVPLETQKKLEVRLRRSAKAARRARHDDTSDRSVGVVFGPDGQTRSVVVAAFTGPINADRKSWLGSVAAAAREKADLEPVILIGVRAEENADPYALIGLYPPPT